MLTFKQLSLLRKLSRRAKILAVPIWPRLKVSTNKQGSFGWFGTVSVTVTFG